MAKPRETALATAVSEQPTALVPVSPDDDLLAYAGAGTDLVRPSDVRPPRLSLCQDGTPQRKRGNPKYIEGLEDGMYFNSLSQEIYGRGPLPIIVIQKLKTNYMQFTPGELGKVLDYDIPEGDPRTRPTLGPDGKWAAKPVATQFDNYLILLPNTGEVMTLSFKSTALVSARQLDSFLAYPMKVGATILTPPPAWARTYHLTTGAKSGAGNTWTIPKVNLVGTTAPDLRAAAASLFDQYAKVTVVVDPEGHAEDVPDDDTVPF
jgi:hypothetical protein